MKNPDEHKNCMYEYGGFQKQQQQQEQEQEQEQEQQNVHKTAHALEKGKYNQKLYSVHCFSIKIGGLPSKCGYMKPTIVVTTHTYIIYIYYIHIYVRGNPREYAEPESMQMDRA